MKRATVFTASARKQIRGLDRAIQKRIRKAIELKLAIDPDAHLDPLVGPLRGLFKWRVGVVRLICERQDETLTILLIKLAPRNPGYDR